MPKKSDITFRIHGLEKDNSLVQADVFAAKFQKFLISLAAADRLYHHRRKFQYFVVKLNASSAEVGLTERLRPRRRPGVSSIDIFQLATTAIYNGQARQDSWQGKMAPYLEDIGSDNGQHFSHIEIIYHDGRATLIDQFMMKQCSEITSENVAIEEPLPLYKGIEHASFMGALEAVDLRGTVWRAKLILTSGGQEIDCVVNSVDVPNLRSALHSRAIAEGIAHYDGVSFYPARLDIKQIRTIDSADSLRRWRGAFRKDEEYNDEPVW